MVLAVAEASPVKNDNNNDNNNNKINVLVVMFLIKTAHSALK